MNLLNVQKNRCAYDFLNLLRIVNTNFVINKKTILNYKMNQNKFSTSIKSLLKEFRSHLRIARALIMKKAIYETSITLQKKSKKNEKFDQVRKSNRFDQKTNRKFENRSCLCERNHKFKNCYYLIKKFRSID